MSNTGNAKCCSKQIKDKTDAWAGRRAASFATNKVLADRLAKKRGGKCLSGPRRKHDKWRWKCGNPEHRVWEVPLVQIEGSRGKKGSWCPQCAGHNVPKKVYRDWAKRFSGKVVKQAKNITDESLWCCRHHGQFTRTFNNMKTTGTFCPVCSASLGERKCKAALEQLFGKRFTKRRFSSMKGIGGKSLEIDLYNEELKLGLEHQGAQHFFKKKYFGEHRFLEVTEHDRRKRAYCAKHGITLIEVRQVGEVTPDGKLKEAIRSALLEQGYSLPQGFDQTHLKIDIAALPALGEIKWAETKQEALRRGWKVVSKRYLGSLTEHAFICDQGHPVSTKPSYLLQGYGCQKCECKPVVLDDGRLFTSISSASKALGVQISSVSRAIRCHGRVRGLRATLVQHSLFSLLAGLPDAKRHGRIKELFVGIPVGQKVGEANGKPVLLGDGRIFSSAYEAARVVGVDGNVALAAAKRPKGKINGVRIAQITEQQRTALGTEPSLIEEFWRQRPLSPRKFMTRRRGILTSLGEVFDGVREASQALGVREMQICDFARREKELQGRRLWYLSQEELSCPASDGMT
jgi:hypothetical protein